MSLSSELTARARELLRARLCDESLAHCERTASTAVGLAARVGVDAGKVELAALLHDYARDVTGEDLLSIGADLRVPVTEFERAHPYLLHARVGAAMVRRDLPRVGEAVLSAIEVHTVGGLPMSDLDKIVYVADMIEPARTFPGVEALRIVCRTEDLDECFRCAYGMTLRYLREHGLPVHPISDAVSASIERSTGRPLFEPPRVRP